MAKNFVCDGNRIAIQAPFAMQSGKPYVVGSLACVALEDAENHEQVTVATSGVWLLEGADGLVCGQTVKIDGGAVAFSTDPVHGKAITDEAGGFVEVLLRQ